MFIHFTFADGSNPYICTSGKRLFHMIKKYYLEQTDSSSFSVIGKAVLLTPFGEKLSAYEENQAILRDFAAEWQCNFHNFNYSMSECAEWSAFFCEYGKKYGLLREFEENGIL